jgi:hypothetical protein
MRNFYQSDGKNGMGQAQSQSMGSDCADCTDTGETGKKITHPGSIKKPSNILPESKETNGLRPGTPGQIYLPTARPGQTDSQSRHQSSGNLMSILMSANIYDLYLLITRWW